MTSDSRMTSVPPWKINCNSFKELKSIYNAVSTCRWDGTGKTCLKLTQFTADALVETTKFNIAVAKFTVSWKLPMKNYLPAAFVGFSAALKTMCLDVLWTKTEMKSLGTGPSISSIVVVGQNVEGVTSFTYMGSVIGSSCRSGPDIIRKISIASTSMGSLSQVWSQGRLSVVSKLRIYNTSIVPVLLYGSEIWSILTADLSRIQAIHMRSQRQILSVRWQDRIRNTTISAKTGLPYI